MQTEQIEVKLINWQPLFEVGYNAIYNGENVKIMYRCVNKSYFVNCNGKMMLVEEKELERVGG